MTPDIVSIVHWKNRTAPYPPPSTRIAVCGFFSAATTGRPNMNANPTMIEMLNLAYLTMLAQNGTSPPANEKTSRGASIASSESAATAGSTPAKKAKANAANSAVAATAVESISVESSSSTLPARVAGAAPSSSVRHRAATSLTARACFASTTFASPAETDAPSATMGPAFAAVLPTATRRRCDLAVGVTRRADAGASARTGARIACMTVATFERLADGGLGRGYVLRGRREVVASALRETAAALSRTPTRDLKRCPAVETAGCPAGLLQLVKQRGRQRGATSRRAPLSVAIDRSRVRRIRASVAMATSSCPAFASAPRAAVIGAASRAPRRGAPPTGAKRRVASTIVPRASADAPPVPAVDIPDTNDEWEAVSPVDFAADVSAALAADKVVILGKRGALRSPGFVASLPESLRTVWLEAVAAVQAGDNGGKRSIMVPWDNGGRLKDVLIGVLPTAVSRHNCPAAAFAVNALLAGCQPPAHGQTLGVITALTSTSDAVPIAVAVARHFPTYTAKSVRGGGRGGVERGRIALRGRVLVAQTCASPLSCDLDAETSARVVAVSRAVRLASRVVDTPPAAMDPDALVGEVAAVAAELAGPTHGLDVSWDALRYDALKACGFGGLVAVGDAAARDGREPALVHVKYRPSGDAPGSRLRKIALVGKGITYDTGGLQIKGKSGMPGMKTDMGGAAATLGAFKALCQLRPQHVELHLVLCIAENAVGPGAFRPDDVVTPLSGRTVEINNTDAEGRLVLADGVAYASGTLGCDDVIDVATLTGAQMIATGKNFAGVLSDDEAMERACVDAGRASGDLAHPLPYAPEFFTKEFGSKIADMKNSVKDRTNAQTSCAGQFIANHLDRGWNKADPDVSGEEETEGRIRRRWLHVDMAGPATNKDGRGTGYGVALLVHLISGELYADGK